MTITYELEMITVSEISNGYPPAGCIEDSISDTEQTISHKNLDIKVAMTAVWWQFGRS